MQTKRGRDWIHTYEDGRGIRDVYLDGRLLKRVVFADTRRGIVRVCDDPVRVDPQRRDRLACTTLRGAVRVVAKGG